MDTKNINSSKMVKNKMRKKTTVEISFELRDKLKEIGKKGDTYEEIIWKLYKKYSENIQ